MAVIGKLSSDELMIEWRIKGFFSLPAKVNEYYCSPDFSFDNTTWNLRIYPEGEEEEWSDGYVDVFLCRVVSTGPPVNVRFSLTLKTIDEKIDTEIIHHYGHYIHFFDLENKFGGIDFMNMSKLLKEKNKLVLSGVFTVFLKMEYLKTSEVIKSECCYCKKSMDVETLSLHDKKCADRPIKCPECSDIVLLLNWYDHKCQLAETEGDNAPSKCSYCKKNLDVESGLLHWKKCVHRPVKCPNCTDVVVLLNLNDHKCQITGAEDDLSILQIYKKMMLDGKNHDLILKIGDHEFRAHRDILGAHSQVFESMLSHDTVEKKNGVIEIPDCDPKAMDPFLSYVYCGKVENLDQGNMLGLYYISDKYDMKNLKRKCCDFIKASLTPKNICEVIQLALNHSDSNLLEHATEYFMCNVLDIMYTVEWQCFLKDNNTQGNELLIKAIKKLKDQNTKCKNCTK